MTGNKRFSLLYYVLAFMDTNLSSHCHIAVWLSKTLEAMLMPVSEYLERVGWDIFARLGSW